MSKKCYRLLDSEREYLKTGTAPGSYRPHELESRVAEKVKVIPSRFEHLFEDIELFERRFRDESSLLDTEAGAYAWAELMGIKDDSTWREMEKAMIFGSDGPESAPANFGVELGKTIGRLMWFPSSDDIEEEDVIADLIWGFLRGLQFDRRLAGEVTETRVQNDVDKILSRIEDRADSYARSLGTDELSESRIQLERQRLMNDAMAVRVHDLLRQDSTIDCERAIEIVERSEEAENDPNDFCHQVVNHLIDTILEEGHTIGSHGQHRSFWGQYGPVEEFDIEEFVTGSKVHTVIEERRLDEKYELKRDLEREAEVLVDKGRTGVSAVDVLPTIVENGPMSSKEIAAQIDSSRDYTASVTRLAKDLAGDDTNTTLDEAEIWTERPLLRGNQERWEATQYGKAAAHALEEHIAQNQTDVGFMKLRPFTNDLLRRALLEVDES